MRAIDRVMDKARQKGALRSADVARMLGVSRQRLANWQARDLPPTSYEAVARTLGISVDELLGRPAFPLSLLERQLVELFRGLTPDHQDDLIAMAQRWHNQAHPATSAANPFGKKSKA